MATRIDSPVTLASLKATISSQAYREFDVLIRHPNPTVAGAKPIPLDLESTSGSIAIRGDGVLIDARAPGGDPTLRRASIVYGGRPAPGIHSIRASDGIALELPADLRFEVDAEAPLGSVSCAFPIGDPQTGRPARLKGSTGADPDVTFKLSTSNNAIEIRKRP
jgi:hypothetical protein